MGRKRRNRSKKHSATGEDKNTETSRFNLLWGKIRDSVTNNGFIRGAKAFEAFKGYKYKFKFQNSGKLSIIDATVRGKRNWVFRLDKPHKGIDTNHININKKFTGIKDPHTPLPNGSLAVGTNVAKGLQYLNKANTYVLMPLSIAMDVKNVISSAISDRKQGTTRQTVETVAQISGGWGGGFGGAMTGAALGNMVLPVVGGIVGSVIGSMAGGVLGSAGANKAVEVIGDKYDYDIKIVSCVECGDQFKIRKYLGELNSEHESFICTNCIDAFARRTCDVCGMLNEMDIENPEISFCESCSYRIEMFKVVEKEQKKEKIETIMIMIIMVVLLIITLIGKIFIEHLFIK